MIWNIYELEYLYMVIIGVASGNQTGKSGKSPNLLYAGLNRKINYQLGKIPGRHVWLPEGIYFCG